MESTSDEIDYILDLDHINPSFHLHQLPPQDYEKRETVNAFA